MMIKNYLLAAKKAPGYLLMWQAIGLAVGTLIVTGINFLFNDDNTYFCIGTLMAAMAGLAGIIGQNNLSGSTRFRLAVSMGMTRRSFLVGDTLVSALLMALAFLSCWVFYYVERWFYEAVFPGCVMEISLDLLFDWRVMAGATALLLLLQLFFTGITQRFGQKGFTTVWLVCCFGFVFIPQSVGLATDGKTSLLAQVGHGILWAANMLTPVVWAVLGGIVAALALVASVCWLWRAEVRL